jgi:hypothetical protein
MLILTIKLSHRREPKKAGDFHPVRPILEKTVEMHFHSPDDVPVTLSRVLYTFNEFKKSLISILRVPI